MRKICIERSTVLAVPLAKARENLRVDGEYMDALITTWLSGIIADAEFQLGQCLMEQTWEVHLDRFPTPIPLPHPVLSVDDVASITYLDANGIGQTLAPAAYQLVRSEYKSSLVPARGMVWPSSADVCTPVVTVKCGYGNTPDKTPANIQLYLLAKLVEQFDPATRSERDTVQSTFIDRLLDACRTYG